jgi:hypothetical protein
LSQVAVFASKPGQTEADFMAGSPLPPTACRQRSYNIWCRLCKIEHRIIASVPVAVPGSAVARFAEAEAFEIAKAFTEVEIMPDGMGMARETL